MRRHSDTEAAYKPGREPGHDDTLISDFEPPELWEKPFSVVYAAQLQLWYLLRQPELANTVEKGL